MSAVLFYCRVQKRKKKSCALFFLNNAVPLCVVIMPLFLYLVTMLTEALSTLASVTLQRLFAGATFQSNFFEVYRRLLLFVGCLCNAAAVSSAKCDKKGTGGRAYLSSFFFRILTFFCILPKFPVPSRRGRCFRSRCRAHLVN